MTNLDVRYARLDLAEPLRRWRREASGAALKTLERNVAKARGKDSVRPSPS